MIEKIYTWMLQEISPDDKTAWELKEAVLGYLEADKGSIGEQEFEAYKDTAFHIAALGEEGGFVKGFKYGFCLCLECLGYNSR